MTEPIARIEASLALLGAEHEPPPGWEDRVLAEAMRGHRRRQLLRWQFAVPIVAAAAIAIIVVIPKRPDRELDLAVTYEKASAVVRGDSHHVGEVMRAAATGGGRYRAVWVYREDRLVVACPGGPQCRASNDATIAELTFELAGDYEVVALSASAPVSPPGGLFDGDVADAERAGAVIKREKLVVR